MSFAPPDAAPIVNEYWYSIAWDVEAIWALDLSVTAFAMDDLAWHLEVPIWPFGGRTYVISPRQVMADRDTYQDEWRRIEAADLSWPIDVIRRKDRWMILDGIHRLAKATVAGATHIDCRIVPASAVRKL